MNFSTLGKIALEASWQGSLVILLILVLRPVIGLRVPSRWRAMLWLLVLLRLLVPAFLLPQNPASLQNLAIVHRPLEQAALALDRRDGGELPRSAPPSQGPEEGEPIASLAGEPARVYPWWIVTTLWLTGATLAGAWVVAATLCLHRRIRRDGGAVPAPVAQIWRGCCEHAGVKHPPRLLATGGVDSPALLGLWRPTLLVPRHADFSLEDWEHIFLHELAHFRRRDHWLQGLQLLALCAHWFNPLVWLGFRCLRADRELAADEWALRHLDARRSLAYGDTLLRVLTAQSGHTLTPGLVGIMEDRAQMRQRLRQIVAFAPRRLAGSLAGFGMVLGLAAVVLGRQVVDLPEYEGLSPVESLVVAARRGDEAAIVQLLDSGVDVDAVAGLRGERSALCAATAANKGKAVRLLVERGATVSLAPAKGETPIILALRRGHRELEDFLLAHGAVCEPEVLAAAHGDMASVQKYLATGARSFGQVRLLGEVAAAHGHRELFALLYEALEGLPRPVEYFSFSRGTFLTAVARGHRGVIEELLARDSGLLRGDGVNRLAGVSRQAEGMHEWLLAKGFTVPEYTDGERLIDAAEREDLPAMRRLLAAGVDVNYRGESDWTPVSKATTWGCPRAVKLLLDSGARPNPAKHGYTTLALARTPEVGNLLLGAGAKVAEADIEYPVGTGSLEMTRWFLDHGAEPEDLSDGGESLLIQAKTPEIVALLVARGAAITSRDVGHLTDSLYLAATTQAMELLLDAGADVKRHDEAGFTPLMRALTGWQPTAGRIALLVRRGADPNARTGDNRTPLMLARDAESIHALVAAGADLYAVSDHGQTVADFHQKRNRQGRQEALARYGIREDAFMETLGRAGGHVGRLSLAAGRGDLNEMEAALAAGADVHERSGAGLTPLHFAVRCGQVMAARVLLEHGANINCFDEHGVSAARAVEMLGGWYRLQGLSDEAKKEAQTVLAALFAQQTLDLEYRNHAGETALLRAAATASHNHALMSILVAGGNLNAQRNDGMTPLMLAVISPPPRDGSVSTVTPQAEPGQPARTYSLHAWHVKLLLDRGRGRLPPQRGRADGPGPRAGGGEPGNPCGDETLAHPRRLTAERPPPCQTRGQNCSPPAAAA